MPTTLRHTLTNLSKLLLWTSVLFLLALAGTSAQAQVLASISGTLHDPSGAVVPSASIAVRNIETGAVRTVTSNESGVYQVRALPVGRYEIKAELSGFKTAVRAGIELVVGQEAVVDLKLEVGEARQEVTVSEEAPLVNATTSSVSGLVSEKAVKDLPLNGRSFDTLIALNPGTTLITNTSSNVVSSSGSQGQGNLFAVSGNRGDFNLFLLNGIEYTGVSSTVMLPGGASHQLLGVDAIREFNVLTNTYGAEYGKRPGAQITAVTMSGTNQFHGTAFEFVRNSFFDARNFFDGLSVPPFRRNQFGAAAGGPIKKDKLFIFGNYEGFRQRLATTTIDIVPDNNARLGLLPTGSGGSLQNVGVAPGIPPFFQLWLPQNGPELSGGGAENFSFTDNSISEDFGTVRGDNTISGKDTLSGVYTIDNGYNLLEDSDVARLLTNLRSQVLSLQETHVFSPTMLTTFRAGFSRADWHFTSAPPIVNPELSFIQGQPIGSISIGGNFGGGASFTGAGAQGTAQQQIVGRNLFTYTADTQITKGIHQIGFGVWFQRVQSNENEADSRDGTVIFGSLGSLLAGEASSITAALNPGEIGWRQFQGAWYVQDAMRLRPNLMVTLGLRHEFNNGWNSPQGLASNYEFGPNGILLTNPVVSDNTYANDHAKLLFGPRVGVAWTPFGEGKTSVRAGYGMYYNMYYNMMDGVGFEVDANPILPSGATIPFNNRVLIGPNVPPSQNFPVFLSPTSIVPGAVSTPDGIQPNFYTPVVQQYTLKVDQGLTSNLMLSVGYVGEHGVHLPLNADMNATIPEVLPNGQFFIPPGSPRANPALGNARYLTMNDNSSYNGLLVDLTRRFSHGMQLRANYTWSKSLDDLSSTIVGGGAGPGGSGSVDVQIPRDPSNNWGPSNFDLRQRFSANVSYELPVGQGKPFLPNLKDAADKVLGGWQVNAIFTVQTGFYFTPLAGFNRSGDGDTRNPDRVSLNPSFSGSPIEGNHTQYFNPAAFILPPPGMFGNAGRDLYAGPGLTEVDLSLFKSTKLTERMSLQFRAELFNIFNNVNFSEPGTNAFTSNGAVSPSAGLITSTYTTARQIQLAMKLIW